MTSTADTPTTKRMSLIVSKGTLDWAYPPFILATTAASLGVKVSMFFTFYGLPLLLKKLDLQVSPLGRPDMAMPIMGLHMSMPNLLAALPGANAASTRMMKNMMARKGIASIEELRDAAVEAGIRMIACQMTMDLLEYDRTDLIDAIELGGAATYMETALSCEINLSI